MSSARSLPPRHTIAASAPLGERFLVAGLAEQGPGQWAGVPHRHEFVELVLVDSGSGWHVVDTGREPVRPGSVHVVAPGQLHHWVAHTPIDGTLVLFREDLLTDVDGVQPPWFRGGFVPDDATTARVQRLVAELRAEQDAAAADSVQVIRALLGALLAVCRRCAPQAPPAAAGLAAKFDRIVRARPSAALTVAECARRLAVTPGHLSETVTAATGSPPGELLRAAIVREAQRLLARTELSCAQIAASLDFEDPSYFSRFFRRETGATPSAYRRGHREAG